MLFRSKQKQKRPQSPPKKQEAEVHNNHARKICNQKCSGCPPVSSLVFGSLAPDGSGNPRQSRPPLHMPPADSIKSITQQRRSILNIGGDDVPSAKSAQLRNGFTLDAAPRARITADGDNVPMIKSGWLFNSSALDAAPRKRNSRRRRKQKLAHRVKQSSQAQAFFPTQLPQPIQPLCTAPSVQFLNEKTMRNSGVDQLGSAEHHMQLACKSSMWSKALGEHALCDANTDVDTTAGVHFRLNSESSVCSLADTQEWFSESDWFS